MSTESNDEKPVASIRTAEIATAILFGVAAVVVMWDSARVGFGWASDGPEAGYFPFYVGLVMFVSSAVTLVTNLLARGYDSGTFVERGQLKLVMKVLIPAIVFVVLVGFIGLYVAAAIFIAFFMGWVGRYGPTRIVPVAVLIPLALFVMFEVWFLVPLPKGPLEALFGY